LQHHPVAVVRSKASSLPVNRAGLMALPPIENPTCDANARTNPVGAVRTRPVNRAGMMPVPQSQ